MSKKDEDREPVEIARDYLELRAENHPEELSGLEHIALSIYNLSDVLHAAFVDDDDEVE